MVDYNFGELIEELGRQFQAYCEEREDPDCFSGGLKLRIEIDQPEMRVNSVTDFQSKLRERISPDHPVLSFKFKIKDEGLGKEILSFQYGKNTGRWSIYGPK